MPTPTDLALSYEWLLDYESAPGVWTPTRFISDLAPTEDPVEFDASTYDDNGAPHNERIGDNWGNAFSILIYRDEFGDLLPDAAVYLDAAETGKRGAASQVKVRWYDKLGRGKGRMGTATVKANRANTGNTGAEKYNITLSPKGELEVIENPLKNLDPELVTATPPAAIAANLLTVRGNNLLGATAVTVGGTAVGAAGLKFKVISNNEISLVMPAGSAGAAPIIVTTPEGASNSLAYTRGA